MSSKRKRKLTDSEIKQIQNWIANNPPGSKFPVRQCARAFGVHRPSIIKALEKIQSEKPPVILLGNRSPVKIEPYSFDIPEELKP